MSVKSRFDEAINTLALGEEPLRERLLWACLNLSQLQLTEFLGDTPIDLIEDFKTFKKDISRMEANEGEGTIRATIAQIENDEVINLARKILYMNEKLVLIERPRFAP